jgi:hypothetical protein
MATARDGVNRPRHRQLGENVSGCHVVPFLAAATGAA